MGYGLSCADAFAFYKDAGQSYYYLYIFNKDVAGDETTNDSQMRYPWGDPCDCTWFWRNGNRQITVCRWRAFICNGAHRGNHLRKDSIERKDGCVAWNGTCSRVGWFCCSLKYHGR